MAEPKPISLTQVDAADYDGKGAPQPFVVVGDVPGAGGGPAAVTSDDITDATATGRSVLTAASQAAARTAIGAGTSSLALGTTASTAKAGDYAPAWGDVTGKPTTFAPAAHAATLVNVAADATNGVAAGNAQVVISALAARIKALEDAAP